MKSPRSVFNGVLFGAALCCLLAALFVGVGTTFRGTRRMPPLQPRSVAAARILAAAKSQQGTIYDAKYLTINYPGGDVPREQGACTDVIVRALRAIGADLQRLIHEDMRRNFYVYPQKWGLPGPNANIDHRRVPNQMRFFERHGLALTCRVTPATLTQWQPGDLVYWDTGRGRLHTGVVSDSRNMRGEPYVIHNGWVCIEDDALTRWKIIGHYRFPQAN
jgi:uncharacterized protein YijF (DUF1287 family)